MGAAKTFISYSHLDEKMRERLVRHLATLTNDGIINLWHDRKIAAGDEFDQTIIDKLEASDLILLLLSPAFLDSKYCMSVEMERAITLHDSGRTRVVPVILQECDWKNTKLNKLNALPVDGRPIKRGGKIYDDSFFQVARGIRTAMTNPDEIAAYDLSGTSSKIDLTALAKSLSDHLLPEWSLGQSDVIELGWQSPVLILPEDMNIEDKSLLYIRTLAHLLPSLRVNAKTQYGEWKRDLDGRYRNDPNVVLDQPLASLSDNTKAYPIDYCCIRGLEDGHNVQTFGATGNVLPVSQDGRVVYLQKRGSGITRHGANQLHVFGGAMDPSFDLGSFVKCAEREFHEESGKTCRVANSPVLLQRERTYRKSMITYLGAVVELVTHQNSEGEVFPVDVLDSEAVYSCFQNYSWVDSGRQAFLIWLALGCPIQGMRNPSVTNPHARDLYRRCIAINSDRGFFNPPRE